MKENYITPYYFLFPSISKNKVFCVLDGSREVEDAWYEKSVWIDEDDIKIVDTVFSREELEYISQVLASLQIKNYLH